MYELIEKFAKYLANNGQTSASRYLRDVSTEFLNVSEAFELGRALQSMYEREIETSQDGKEILKIIEYVRDNIRQAKY